MATNFIERNQTEPAVAPDADFMAGTVSSDVINMKDWETITFVIIKGEGATGTTVITVLECDDTTPSNSAAIPFLYTTRTDFTGADSAVAAAASTGLTTTAGSNQIYKVEVNARDLSEGYPYVQLVMTEAVDDPCDGGVLAILSGGRSVGSANAANLT